MKWYSTPSFSPGRGARVVCETENRRPSSSFRTRVTTVVLPAPEGAETTITLPPAPCSLNVLHLFPELLDLRFQIHDLAHHRRVRRLRSEEHTSELQSPDHLVCRLLLEKKKYDENITRHD